MSIGSEYDREVINKNKITPEGYNKFTLKDTDFFNLEKKINIQAEYAESLKEMLLRDAEFFKKMKLMDYSLLVKKTNWKKYLEEHPNETEESVSL